MVRTVAVLAAVFLLLGGLLSGCSSKPLEPVPVTGQAKDQDGNPLADVVLTFYPQDEANKMKRASVVTDKKGNFSAQCLKGRYKVTFIMIPKEQGSTGKGPGGVFTPGSAVSQSPQGLYQNPQATPWEIDVPDQGMDNLVLKIK